jgi:multidrug efflux system membrane fusion protein
VVAGGLAAGQTVITAGVHTLTPGQRVKLYAEPGTPNVGAAAAAANLGGLSTAATAATAALR